MSKHRFEAAEVVIVNGQLCEGAKPALLANLPGVLRGEGIFETFLVEDGVACPFLPEHDERLALSARLLGMDLQGRYMAQDFSQILPLVQHGCWRVRYTILRGLDRQLIRMWTAGLATPPPAEVALYLSSFRQDPASPIAGAKTISRANFQVAHAQAVENNCFDALLPTIDGDLSECTSSNLLVYQGGVLRTPGLDRGILGGVTRKNVLETCRKHDIKTREEKIWPNLLAQADEVYVTNAIIGVIPVCKIHGVRERLPGSRGEFLPVLRQAYAAARSTQSPTGRQEIS
jgi:branched-subunit amino acid aminotransferase/4-amino-4-deoxychorismate lyase